MPDEENEPETLVVHASVMLDQVGFKIFAEMGDWAGYIGGVEWPEWAATADERAEFLTGYLKIVQADPRVLSVRAKLVPPVEEDRL